MTLVYFNKLFGNKFKNNRLRPKVSWHSAAVQGKNPGKARTEAISLIMLVVYGETYGN
jgi:hypothetical protein